MLYNIVNNMVSCTSKLIKRVDVILCSYHKETKTKQKQRDIKSLWEMLDMSITLFVDSITSIYIYPTHQIVYI